MRRLLGVSPPGKENCRYQFQVRNSYLKKVFPWLWMSWFLWFLTLAFVYVPFGESFHKMLTEWPYIQYPPLLPLTINFDGT